MRLRLIASILLLGSCTTVTTNCGEPAGLCTWRARAAALGRANARLQASEASWIYRWGEWKIECATGGDKEGETGFCAVRYRGRELWRSPGGYRFSLGHRVVGPDEPALLDPQGRRTDVPVVDLVGTGRPAVYVHHWGGGAHGPHDHWILELGPDGAFRVLGDWSTGEGRLFLNDLDGDGTCEVVKSSNNFLWWSDWAGSCFPTEVWDWDPAAGAWVFCNDRFRSVAMLSIWRAGEVDAQALPAPGILADRLARLDPEPVRGYGRWEGTFKYTQVMHYATHLLWGGYPDRAVSLLRREASRDRWGAFEDRSRNAWWAEYRELAGFAPESPLVRCFPQLARLPATLD